MKNTVKVERAIKDITQQELATAVGVNRQTINSIEAGGYIPSGVLMLKIAKYFGKPDGDTPDYSLTDVKDEFSKAGCQIDLK